MTTRWRLTRLYVPMLALVLGLLYLALADIQPSTAEVIPSVMTFEAAQPSSQEEIIIAAQVLKKRFWLHHSQDNSEPNLIIRGNQLAVSLPPNLEPSVFIAEASRVGQVVLVDGGTEFLTIGSRAKTGPRAIPDQNVYQAVLTNADFESVEAKLTEEGHPVIQFTLTSTGDARLAAHTAEQRGYYLCLVLDGQVVNCPILRTPLKNRQGAIELTGDASLEDAQTLATLLHSGPLPSPLKLVNR